MISTRGRYALRMMLDLAENQGDGYVSLKDIAARQDISKKYLEQIIPVLNRAGLLQTTRGVQGGYRLTRRPEEYTVLDILSATETGLAAVACLEQDANPCARCCDCLTLPVWQGLDKVVKDYLDGITLQDVLDRRNVGNDYVI
ncbi:Rrf2 family transcriptional regulator [Pseudoflavonifractor sp. MSJ-30]|uniref:RrF2 family transcriptional regulator n=1 Tax=Pseudoflavonifractor sp. MSJ-30 TaxID=2841525 RepID=UPI001C123D2E|nr:Rrf2 family transcriptional regulator [Pseudoflavonifractor sp. MSJ-30]